MMICHPSLRIFDSSLGDFKVPLCIFVASRRTFKASNGKFSHSKTPTKSGGGPPQSKTLARWPVMPEWREASWTAPVPWRFGTGGCGSRCESAHYFAGGVWMERTHVRCYREKQAERGRPRPQQGTDGDAPWMFRWRLGWQRCCARGRARSGLISGWPVGTNAVPKSFCDGRLGQLAFECLDCLKVKI